MGVPALASGVLSWLVMAGGYQQEAAEVPPWPVAVPSNFDVRSQPVTRPALRDDETQRRPLRTPGAARLELNLGDVDWQPLPREINRVVNSPDGRAWLLLAPPQPARPLAEIRRQLASEYHEQMPQIDSADLLHFDSSGRAWFTVTAWQDRNRPPLLVCVGPEGIETEYSPPAPKPLHLLPPRYEWLPIVVERGGRMFFFTLYWAAVWDGKSWTHHQMRDLRQNSEVSEPAVFNGAGEEEVLVLISTPEQRILRYRDREWSSHAIPLTQGARASALGIFAEENAAILAMGNTLLRMSFGPKPELEPLLKALDDPDPNIREKALRDLQALPELDGGHLARAAEELKLSPAAQKVVASLIYDLPSQTGRPLAVGPFRVEGAMFLWQESDGTSRLVAGSVETEEDGRVPPKPEERRRQDDFALVERSPEGRYSVRVIRTPEMVELRSRVLAAGPRLRPPHWGDETMQFHRRRDRWGREQLVAVDPATGQDVAVAPSEQFVYPQGQLGKGSIVLSPYLDRHLAPLMLFRPGATPAARVEARSSSSRGPACIDGRGWLWFLNLEWKLMIHDGNSFRLPVIAQVKDHRPGGDGKLPEIEGMTAGEKCVLLTGKREAALVHEGVLQIYPGLEDLLAAHHELLGQEFRGVGPASRLVTTEAATLLYADETGVLWLKLPTGRLVVWSGEGSISTKPLTGDPGAREPLISMLRPVGDGRGVLLTVSGAVDRPPGPFLAYVREGELQLRPMPAPPLEAVVESPVYDAEGNLWYATGPRINHSQQQENVPYCVWSGVDPDHAKLDDSDDTGTVQDPWLHIRGTIPYWFDPQGQLWVVPTAHWRRHDEIVIVKDDKARATIRLGSSSLKRYNRAPPVDDGFGGAWAGFGDWLLHLSPSDHHDGGWRVDGAFILPKRDGRSLEGAHRVGNHLFIVSGAPPTGGSVLAVKLPVPPAGRERDAGN